jgi:hypothetical protein
MITPQIIHDPRKSDRLPLLMDELSMQNINNAVIWEATINLATVEASINKSHKDIIRWAKERDLDEVCIFEDDLMFQDQYSWKTFLDNKPDSFDLYMGGAYGMSKVGEDVGGSVRVERFVGMHCYICSKRYYDTFLGVSDDEHIDQAQAGLGAFYVCSPMIGYQRPGYSSTAKKMVNYNL